MISAYPDTVTPHEHCTKFSTGTDATLDSVAKFSVTVSHRYPDTNKFSKFSTYGYMYY